MDSGFDNNANRGGSAGAAAGISGSPDDMGGARALKPADLARALRGNAMPIAFCALAGAAAAYGYASMLPKSFTSYSAIAVGGDSLSIPELQGVLRADTSPDPMPFVRTEVQALQSRQLVASVVQDLQLDHDPEFNAALRKQNWAAGVKNWLKSLLPHAGLPPEADASNDSIINAVSHAFAISQDNRSLVIGISFTAQDPGLAASAANDLVAGYMAGRQDRRTSADRGANAALTVRIDQVRGEINQIERQMQSLRARSGVVAVRAGSVGQQQVEDLATAAARATEQRTEIEANLARAQAAVSSGDSDDLASVLGSQTISRLREQESEAAGKVADLSARFGPAYPALRSAQADLSAIRRGVGSEAHRIVASLASQVQVARAHEADIEAQLQKANEAGAKAQDVQAQLQQLSQDAATRRALYSTLLERAQQTVAQPHADELPDVRVLTKATPPGLPSAPDLKLSTGLGGMAGALLGGFIAVARSLGRRRFQGIDDIEAATGATVLARLVKRGGAARWQGMAAGTADLTADERTALRAVLTRLSAGSRAGAGRVIAVIGDNAGKPSAGTAMAAIMARLASNDHRVLLVEPPSANGQRGARSTADWRDRPHHDAAQKLDVVRLDSTAEQPAGRVALENLLVDAREDYDLIILSGAAHDDANTLALARTADATVMLIDEATAEPETTHRTAARLATMSRARLNAVVLASA